MCDRARAAAQQRTKECVGSLVGTLHRGFRPPLLHHLLTPQHVSVHLLTPPRVSVHLLTPPRISQYTCSPHNTCQYTTARYMCEYNCSPHRTCQTPLHDIYICVYTCVASHVCVYLLTPPHVCVHLLTPSHVSVRYCKTYVCVCML